MADIGESIVGFLILGIVLQSSVSYFLADISKPQVYSPTELMILDIILKISRAIIVISAIIFFYKSSVWIYESKKHRKLKKEAIKTEIHELKEKLSISVKSINLEEIQKLISYFEEKQSKYQWDEKQFLEFIEPINEKLSILYMKKIEEEHELLLKKTAYERELEECKIRELKHEEIRRKRELASENFEILSNLNPDENIVFKKSNLTEKERKALIQNKYEPVNEFCVYEMKRIPVLVKPKSNHSVTHAFLVWSVKKLLKSINKIKNIKEHLSKDADITFEFNGREYALEIETGTLLGKSEQIKEKISYLNRKYENSWMFIVSNRNLIGKYSKFGLTSQRKDVLKNIQKMLKIA